MYKRQILVRATESSIETSAASHLPEHLPSHPLPPPSAPYPQSSRLWRSHSVHNRSELLRSQKSSLKERPVCVALAPFIPQQHSFRKEPPAHKHTSVEVPAPSRSFKVLNTDMHTSMLYSPMYVMPRSKPCTRYSVAPTQHGSLGNRECSR